MSCFVVVVLFFFSGKKVQREKNVIFFFFFGLYSTSILARGLFIAANLVFPFRRKEFLPAGRGM